GIGTVDPVAEERFAIYESMAWADYWQDRERLLLEALFAINAAEQGNYAYGAAVGSFAMGVVCDLVPVFWLADRYHRRAIRIAEKLGHPLALGHTYQGLATHYFYKAEWQSAIDYHDRGADILRRAGHLRGWGAG